MFYTPSQMSDFIQDEVKTALHAFFQENPTLNLLSTNSGYQNCRFLTRKQVSQYLGIGLSTVDYWARIGKLTKVHLDGSIRFDKEAIDQSIRGLKKYSSTHISSLKTSRL